MQYGKWIVAIGCGFFMAACGPTLDQDSSLQGMDSTRSALYCSATCPNANPISCYGSVCSAVDNQYVECDGVRHYCPGCVINGQYYANGTANPSNTCQWCNTSVSTTSWTNHNYSITNGVPGFCKYNTCLASQCAGSYCEVHGGQCDGYCQGGVLRCGGI